MNKVKMRALPAFSMNGDRFKYKNTKAPWVNPRSFRISSQFQLKSVFPALGADTFLIGIDRLAARTAPRYVFVRFVTACI